MQAYMNTWNKYIHNITHNILYNSNGTKKSSNLLSDHFLDTATIKSADSSPWSYTAVSWKDILQSIHFRRIKVFQLYLYKTCGTSEIFAFFFWLCHIPSVTVKSPWPIRTNYQQQIPQPLMFIKYLRNFNEAPTKYTGVLCFVFNLQRFCLKIQTFKAIWCWAA